jgi:hypothetical protein
MSEYTMDAYTQNLLDTLLNGYQGQKAEAEIASNLNSQYKTALEKKLTKPVLEFFENLLEQKEKTGSPAQAFGFNLDDLARLAAHHESIDEHGVTLGGRLGQARPIVQKANARVADYLAKKDTEAPSGIQLWERMLENRARIMSALNMTENDWNSYQGQLKHRIDDVDTLAKCIELPAAAITEVTRVTKDYRMRLTPYYASLIRPGVINDPVLLQSVPTAEMVDNLGEEMPPVAADHSPARLVDQFYPRC